MNLKYYKTFFWPPEEFLEKIDFKENHQWGIDIIPYLSGDVAKETYMIGQVEKVRSIWLNKFRFSNNFDSKAFKEFEEKNHEWGFTQHSLLSISELIKNTFEHGNKNNPGSLAHFGYWMSEQSMVIGIKDEGSFYSKQETANSFEERFLFDSTKEDPSGLGIVGMYDDSDFFKVVIEQNAFFAGFLFQEKT